MLVRGGGLAVETDFGGFVGGGGGLFVVVVAG